MHAVTRPVAAELVSAFLALIVGSRGQEGSEVVGGDVAVVVVVLVALVVCTRDSQVSLAVLPVCYDFMRGSTVKICIGGGKEGERRREDEWKEGGNKCLQHVHKGIVPTDQSNRPHT